MSVVASVVIATRNRARLLEQCLTSLHTDPPPTGTEILVVDNGSIDTTPEILREATRRWPHLRSIVEARTGSAHALHAGALAARGRVLVFLDDDMVAVEGLLARHLHAHREEPGGCVLGHVLSAPSPKPFDRMQAYIFDGARMSLSHRPPQLMDYWSGNVSLERDLYFRLGGYSEEFARIGYGKDWDFGRKLIAAGIRMRFVPEALTYHHFTESFADRLVKARGVGYACAHINAKHPECGIGGAMLARSGPLDPVVLMACRVAAFLLEPFDRGPGVPMKPLAFAYDRGLRLATARGVSDFYSASQRPNRG